MNSSTLAKAEQLHREGHLDDAAQLYRELLESNDNDDHVWHNYGILLAQSGDLAEAKTAIEKAISLKSDLAPYHNSLGNVFLKQQNFADAISAYQNASNCDPDYAIAYNNLGNCYYRQGDLTKAEEYYRQAILKKPAYPDALTNLGILLMKLGKDQEAETTLKQAIKLNPDQLNAYSQLGDLYLQRDDYTHAQDYFEQRLGKSPYHAESFHGLGVCHLKQHDYEQAVIAFEHALALAPQHPEANQNLATAYLAQQDLEKALGYYMRQLEISPMVESYYNVGVLLMYQERTREAIDYFNQAKAIDPNYLPTYLNLGAQYLKLNKTDLAIDAYESAAKLDPDNLEIQHILAAIKQDETPSAAPPEYLQHLFDEYASYYDQHLRKFLDYQVPEKIIEAIEDEKNINQVHWNVLDLGCGTGLCAYLLRPLAQQLTGIDISPEMIKVAESKEIYDQLEVMDVKDALEKFQGNDLIVAADVFTYIGDLDAIFSKAHQALTNEGCFIFTVEKTEIEPYTLQRSIRYAHSKTYLESLIEKYYFKALRFDTITLRKQRNQPVEGYLVLLTT